MITQEQKQYNHTNESLSSSAENRRTDCLPACPTGQPASQTARTVGGFTTQDLSELGWVDELPGQDYNYIKGKLALYEAQEAIRQEEFDKETQRLQREWEREKEEAILLAEQTAPRLVIRGVQSETHPTPLPQNTIIDHVAFTCDETSSILQELTSIFIPSAVFFETANGMLGYKRSVNINLYGQVIGKIAYGSTHGRNYLQLSGTACKEIKDWQKFKHYLSVMKEVKLTRVDIAADFYYGEVTLEYVRLAYDGGKFKLEKARTNPIYDLRQPIGGDGYPLGWTAYIGKRTGSKMARIYHKGAEQFGKMNRTDQEICMNNWQEIGILNNKGEPATMGDWVRAEIEYKSKDVELSPDILINTDEYFSGAYPYFKELLPLANPTRPKSIPHTLELEEEKIWANLRNAYGSFLTTMRASGKYTEGQLLDKACNGKHSQRLIKAGGLDMVKPYNPSPKAPQDE